MRPPCISPVEWRFLIGFDPDTDPEMKKVRHLKDWANAPDVPGIYEIGLGTINNFEVKYIGKAVDQTLRVRLRQHADLSSNKYVRAHSSVALFRCRTIRGNTQARKGKELHDVFKNNDLMIDTLEGHFIIAFRELYVWNLRNEWKQMGSFDFDFKELHSKR